MTDIEQQVINDIRLEHCIPEDIPDEELYEYYKDTIVFHLWCFQQSVYNLFDEIMK